MSIVRLWQAGAETGSNDEFSVVNDDAQFTASTEQANTGNYSFRDGNVNDYAYVDISGYTTRQIRTGFYIYGNTGLTSRRFQIGSTNLINLEFVTDGSARLYIGGVQQDSESGMNVAEWHHIGVDAYIDTTGGWAYVYWDGSEVMSFDGNTGDVDINRVYWGHITATNFVRFYYDDLYIDNSDGEASPSAPPIKLFYSITPNADGNYSQWLGSDNDSTNNYQLVDEVPPSDSDYVVTTGTNNLDSYNMSTFTLGTGEVIEAVIPTVRTKRTSTTEQIVLGARLSSTNLLGVVQDPGTSFAYLFERLTGTPSGGDWEQSDLDGVELLMASTGTY